MDPDAERFIDLATRPLADDPELRLTAIAELEKAIAANPAAGCGPAADALTRADTRPHRRGWWIALCLVTLVVSLPLLAHTVRQLFKATGFPGVISGATPKPSEIPNLNAAQKLLLDGDEKASNVSDRWKPLWQSEPDNAAYLAEYAAAYSRDHKQLSSEILAAVERVDPDNGWFLALAAGGIADGAVTRAKRSKKEIADRKAAVLTLTDGKRLEEALALIHQLVGKPRFTSYQTALFKQRIPLFPPRRDWMSQIPLLAYTAGINSSSIPFRKFPDALAAGAEQCAAKGDATGFRQILQDWHSLVDITARNGDTLVDLLIAKATIFGPAENFRDAARTLGLDSEARYFEELSKTARADKERKDRAEPDQSAKDKAMARRLSILGGLASPAVGRQVQSPPPVTDADFLPARHADHALFGRVFSGFVWMLLGLTALTAASALRCQSPLTRRLATRMRDLLHRSDWAWLFVGGLVFPVLWYLWISRLTPLAAREWSVGERSFIPFVGQFGSFILSGVILSVVIASWRLGKRGAAVGLVPRFSWPGWLAAIAALAAVPAFGAIPYDGPMKQGILIFSFVLAGIAAGWIGVGLLSGTLARQSQTLRRATLARVILPVSVSMMLVMALSIRFHYAEEQHWIQRDHFGEISTDSPSLSRYEHQVTQILRREVLEMLGDLPGSN